MPQIQIIRKGYLPFGKAEVQIDNSLSFGLRGRKKLMIELPEGDHAFIVRIGISTTTQTIKVTSTTSAIALIPALPDGFFIAGMALPFFALRMPDNDNWFALFAFMLLFYLVAIVYFFGRPNKFFKCVVWPNE
jgi:hypothetical protein